MKKPGYGRLFEGLNYAGVILALLAAVGMLVLAIGPGVASAYLWALVLVAFLAGQFLMVVAAVSTTRIRLGPKKVAALIGLYTLLSLWDLVSLAIGLPFIALTMILGPLMVVVAVLSAVVLGLYLVEGVMGYDVRGYVSLLENPFQALVALAFLVASLAVLGWHLGEHESADWLLEKAGDLMFSLRQRLRGAVGRIIQQ